MEQTTETVDVRNRWTSAVQFEATITCAPLTRLQNDLRAAQLDWASYAAFDAWPGQPWAAHRDEAAARIVALKAKISAASDLRKVAA